MTEVDLANLLEDLVDKEFKNFKWFLKTEKLDDIEPIKAGQLEGKDRQDTVDLMVQKYEFAGAVKVMRSVLKKINRNDLLTKLSSISSGAEGGESSSGARGEQKPTTSEQPAGPGPAVTQSVPADMKLMSVRTQFIDKVSEPVLRQLLDKLLECKVINDGEMEFAGTPNRAENARKVIDVVRKKGTDASSALIAALCEMDPFLSKQLNLQ